LLCIAPPAAATLSALKEVAKGRHKRPRDTVYVILIPRLLYQEEWRSRFQKEVDVWFPLSTGEFWPHSAFEPLMVGISFPLYRTHPWQLRMERDKVVDIGRTLSHKCQRRVTYESGIICANYGVTVGVPSRNAIACGVLNALSLPTLIHAISLSLKISPALPSRRSEKEKDLCKQGLEITFARRFNARIVRVKTSGGLIWILLPQWQTAASKVCALGPSSIPFGHGPKTLWQDMYVKLVS
jgi:hypothetical protein